ncbi:MAG: M6 family metalloprotease domain-containing protein [Candidatus Eisenbacteria bacterium]
MRPATSLLVLLLIFLPISAALSMPLRPDLLQRLYEENRLDEAREAMEDEVSASQSLASHLAAGPHLGTIRVLVLLVDFSDVPADTILHGREWARGMLFDPANQNSMRNYYFANSYGKLNVTGEVFGWFRVKEKMSYYAAGRRGLGNYPRNTQKMIEDAIDAADSRVDFSQFDNDGPDGIPNSGDDDGLVDFLLVVHAGQGYEWTMNVQDIQSYASAIRDKPVDGVKVLDFATEPEEGQVGTFAHELGHLLGLPDLYDLSLNSFGLGMWSLMSYGSWGGGDGSHPVGLDAWSKTRLGFVTPIEIETNAPGWRLPCVEDVPSVLRLWSEGEGGPQYFLVENRRAKSYDSYLSNLGEGLLVYHVDERARGNSTEGRHLVSLEQADGRFDLDQERLFGFGSDRGDPFPGSTGARTFSWWTTPSNYSNEDLPTEVSLRNITGPGDTVTVDIEVASPVILFESLGIDDTAGDGDGEADPGEDVTLNLRLRNYGTGCSGVLARIRTADPLITLEDPVATVDLIPGHGLSRYLAFRMKIDQATPQPHSTEFDIEITGTSSSGSYSSSDRFLLAVPIRRLAGWPRETGSVIFSSPSIGDLDGDGVKEIVLGDYSGSVYAWRPDGTLLADWPVAVGGRTTSKPAICDVDIDGSPDVVVGSQNGKVYVFSNRGSLLSGWPQATGGTITSSAALGDIDDDGVVEIICGSKDGKVYAWNDDGSPVKGWPVAMAGYEIWMSPGICDFDDDYVPEVVVGGYGGKLYIIDGDGTILSGWPVLFGWGCGGGSPAIADFDGDGAVEIVVSGLFSNSIYMVGVDGKVRKGWPRWAYNCEALSSPAPVDMDNDGLPEVAVTTSCGTMVAWNADGTPCTAIEGVTQEFVEYCEPIFGDLDGNGYVEGLFGTASGATSRIYAFGKDGRTVGFPVEVAGSVWATPSVADLEGDGYDEIVVATTSGQVQVWRFIGAKPAGRHEWSQSRGDLWNTGYYGFTPRDNIPLADLVITSSSVSFGPDIPKQGQNLAIGIHAFNTGHASADNFRISVYHDEVADSLLIGSVVIPSLAAKDDTSVTFAWRVPGQAPTRLVIAQLDPDDVVLERFELNNTARQRFYLSVPDLEAEISGLEPFPVVIGDSLAIHATVRNMGADVARAFAVSFYDSAVTDSRRFATLQVDSIAPGGHVDLSVRYRVGPFQDDFMVLWCAADPTEGVLEYYRSNNVAQRKVNSGIDGEIIAPSLLVPPRNFGASRTGLAIEPTSCTCILVTEAGEPFRDLYEAPGSDPDISRNSVVFSSQGDIAGFDLKTGSPFVVSASQETETQPAIWGENVVWVSEASESTSLRLKRGSGAVERLRTVWGGTISAPDISHDIVVWEARHVAPTATGYDIWACDLDTDSIFAVSTVAGDQVSPAAWGSMVVWEDRSRDGGDIYAMDTASRQIVFVAEKPGLQQHPDIFGELIVWQDFRDGNWDIFGYSLTTGEEFPVSRQAGNQVAPCVSDSTVLWIDKRAHERLKGLKFGGTRSVADVREFEALSQDALIRVVLKISEREDAVSFRLYRSTEKAPVRSDRDANVREFFTLQGDSLHAFEDTVVAERRPYYYSLGVIDGYGEETFHGPVSGQAFRRSPARFLVGNPFPNPFMRDAEIAFGLPRRIERPRNASWPDPAPETSPIEVKVYSVAGQLVRTIKSGTLIPGYYRVSWDGRDEDGARVSPGMYFFSIVTQGSSSSRKAILVR